MADENSTEQPEYSASFYGFGTRLKGIQGPAGKDGDQGPEGPTGPEGPGPTQSQLAEAASLALALNPPPKGDTGDKGDQGSQGIQGLQGIQGDQGLIGPQGIKGDKGDTGSQGIQGPIGLTGVQGPQGVKGDTGSQGLIGLTGSTGPKGDTGDQGVKGDTGDQGPIGPTGLTGPKGDKGDQGDTGPQGSGTDALLLNGQSAGYYTNITARLGYTPANRAGDTFTGAVIVRDGSGAGGVSILSGTSSNAGYITFIRPNGTRAGYVGNPSETGGEMEYGNDRNTGHKFYGGDVKAPGVAVRAGEIFTDAWLRVTGAQGVYWDTTSRSICPPELLNIQHGTVAIGGIGRGGWSGYAISNRTILMSDLASTAGVYDFTGTKWLIHWDINTGDTTFPANVTAYSDIRTKTDVDTIKNALALVGDMRGVRYNQRDTGRARVGVIAQELREVLPEVVVTPEDPNGLLSVDYGNIVGVLIEAIKELKVRVEYMEGLTRAN